MNRLTVLLEQEGILQLPGVYDALSSRIACRAGFPALYMSGFAVAGSLLGQPDIGLVTATEMIERAAQITAVAGDVPLVADGDNGYGGANNVARLVRAYQQVGAACVQLEDQVSPKKCGHMADKAVVPRDEAVARIKTAVAARSSDDFLIMARTDARSTHDLDEALWRADAFLAAGADLLFVEALQSIDEMQRLCDRFPDVPLVANMVEDGKTPILRPFELEDIGFKVVLYPITSLLAVAATLTDSYGDIFLRGHLDPGRSRLSFSEYNALVGLDEALRRDGEN